VDSETVERKLAAILSADAVGYSRLMSRDEAATVRTLKAHLDAMDGLIRQHGGRVVDAVGDNLLAEFRSAVDAVACGVGIQRELEARNARISADRRMPFRIGINLGDVIVQDDRIAGDGVNVAARLEALADPGGISISRAVLEQVEGKLPLEFQDGGEQRLKNIPRPVHVFRVELTAPDSSQAGEEHAPAGPAELSVPGFSGRHALAVLPFDNMSGDPEQEYFADGIAEDLLARLSAFREFPVIARNSSFVYKGKAVDLKAVSRDLGVRYVVEGSVRKAGNRVRVTAQLIDATTSHHVWAERYDRELSDIFSLQDEITERIVASLVPALTRVEIRRAVRRPPQNLDAWDCTQRGLWHLLQYTKDDNIEAQSWARRAIEQHPDSSAALSVLAFSHLFEVIYQWSESPARSREEALRCAEKSVALDESDSNAQFALGFATSLAGQYERAMAVLQRAIELNPSSALAHWALGAALTPCGCPDSAIPLIEKAIRLSPHDPWMHEFLFNLAAAHFAAERYEQSVTFAKRSLQSRSEQPGAYRLLAASYGHLGRAEEAKAALDALLRLAPDLSAAQLRVFLPPAIVERYVEGLRRAGWKE
jgi:adenylate cyclase